MRFLLCFLLALSTQKGFGQQFPSTRFESSGGIQTPVYSEIIRWWKAADAASPLVKMTEMGPTDAGYNLHLVLVSADGSFDLPSLKRKGKTVILVNNGIHPGEPDGIDASMLLVRDIIQKKTILPANVVLALIPVYNIGGCLNRSPNYRVDQNGPEEFGFRGNSQNLDLNRDFIKADSKEALSFARIFRMLDPDIFVDNHVSNGADYQHVMTLLTTQHNKLGGALGEFLNRTLEPELYRLMKQRNWDLVPYVNHFGETPEKGWNEFWDSPRYSSGYAALWNTLAFVPETHMLKPYDQRVRATRDLMLSFLDAADRYRVQILDLRRRAFLAQQTATSFPLAWKWDPSRSVAITFRGYESGYKTSEVSGLPRLFYDRSKPFEKQVPFFNHYSDTLSAPRPKAFLIPQGWWKVIERLQANGVKMRRLSRDTTLEVQVTRIESYQASPRVFEGHHLNTNVRTSQSQQTLSFRAGDWFIPLDGPANRFLMETLHPQAEDSYFAWNFFDPILGQKEGYSGYVFEETAAAYLKEHPELQQRLDQRRAADSNFRKSANAQLNFVYQNSRYFEPAYLRYPVYSVF